jgi:hypothetical protein
VSKIRRKGGRELQRERRRAVSESEEESLEELSGKIAHGTGGKERAREGEVGSRKTRLEMDA